MKLLQLTIPKPGLTFLSLVVIFQFLPGLYIVLNGDFTPTVYLHSNAYFHQQAAVFLSVVTVNLVLFVTLYFVITGGRGFSLRRFEINTLNPSKEYLVGDRVFHLFWVMSLIFIIIYASNGGTAKIFLIGSDVDSREFRFIGFDNIPRIYTALLQVSRRFFLPVAILFFLFKRKMGYPVHFSFLLFLFLLQLFASAMTMSRAPFLTLFVVLAIPQILAAKSKSSLLLITGIGAIFLVYFAAFLTKIQYNIVDFNMADLLSTGLNFIVNRMWVVPAVTPINLSFANFDFWSDKLMLVHSRLSVLWGGNAVGTAMDNSIFVTPVGFIGDIWRNFGIIGVLIHSFFCSVYFIFIDNLSARAGPIGAALIFFMTVALVLYWIMGVFFSQGAFVVMLLLPLVSRFFLRA